MQQFPEPVDEITESEAGKILHELYREQEPPPVVGHDPTLAALCELTGQDEHLILSLLQEVRRKERERQLVETMLELERPLYAVERPSPNSTIRDPFLEMQVKRSQVESLLESAEQKERLKKIGRKKLVLKESSSDRTVALLALLFFIAIFAYLIIRASLLKS